MIRKMLYRTEREGGGYTVSTVKPPKGAKYRIRWRLVADEGRAITDGENVVTVIDLLHRKDCEKWSDCEKPEEEDPTAIVAAGTMPPSEEGGLETEPEQGPEAGKEGKPVPEDQKGEAYDD